MVSVRCRGCGSVYKKPYTRIGVKAVCPYCHYRFIIKEKDLMR